METVCDTESWDPSMLECRHAPSRYSRRRKPSLWLYRETPSNAQTAEAISKTNARILRII
ncbi:MAG: hypothetical protein AAGG48_28750 [Planctomycetota bacterium]